MHDLAFEEYIFELSSLLGVRYSARTERNYELEQGLRAHLFNSELRDARWRSRGLCDYCWCPCRAGRVVIN